jgi:uncharacterized protein YjbJ (UPF0337 family)
MAKARKGFSMSDKVGGHFDKLIGLLQEKYGYTRQQAEEEYKKRTK